MANAFAQEQLPTVLFALQLNVFGTKLARNQQLPFRGVKIHIQAQLQIQIA